MDAWQRPLGATEEVKLQVEWAESSRCTVICDGEGPDT